MDCLGKLEAAAATCGGIITTREAEAQGVSRAMLSRLNEKGQIIRIAQGQYIMADDLEDELLSISIRSSNLALSHETALWLHGISDRTPFFHAVTAPTGKAPSKSILKTCKVYYVRPKLFDLGKERLTTQWGNKVVSYNLERTICDCIRNRNRMGITRLALRYLETLL